MRASRPVSNWGMRSWMLARRRVRLSESARVRNSEKEDQNAKDRWCKSASLACLGGALGCGVVRSSRARPWRARRYHVVDDFGSKSTGNAFFKMHCLIGIGTDRDRSIGKLWGASWRWLAYRRVRSGRRYGLRVLAMG